MQMNFPKIAGNWRKSLSVAGALLGLDLLSFRKGFRDANRVHKKNVIKEQEVPFFALFPFCFSGQRRNINKWPGHQFGAYLMFNNCRKKGKCRITYASHCQII